MVNSGLVELLKAMTSKELDDFNAFMESPFFNKGRYRKEGLCLIKLLTVAAPDFVSEQISKENLYPEVFPGEPFKEGKIEKVMVDISKMIRQFWLIDHYFDEEQEDQAQIDFARILRKKGLQHRSEIIANAALKKLEEKVTYEAEDYEQLFNVSALINTLDSQNINRKGDLNVSRSLRFQDLAYYSKRLIMLNYCLHYSKISRLVINLDLEEELRLVNKMNVVDGKESPSLYVAQEIFRLYSTPIVTKENFENTLSVLRDLEWQIDKSSLKNYFGLVRSYCTVLINAGNRNLEPILHQINMDNLAKGYFYHLGHITSGGYINIANLALKAGELEWAAKFIEEHKGIVLGETEDFDCYKLNMSNYHFYKGNYDLALELLPTHFQKLDFLHMAKCLELMIYYETESDLFEYKLDAFKMYINRASKKTLPDETKERYVNFVNLLYQINNSNIGDKKRGQTIARRIEEKSLVAMKDWLIEKALQLK